MIERKRERLGGAPAGCTSLLIISDGHREAGRGANEITGEERTVKGI